MASPESLALRHVFAAERAATKIPDVPADTPLRPIGLVGVIGAGTMGGGISMNYLNAGIPVILLEQKEEALQRGVATIRKNYENTMKKGRITAEQVEERMKLLSTTLSYDALGEVDLVIEAVFEDMGVKEVVFRELDRVIKPGAILASNTSTLDVDQIASFTKRPQDVIGLHFFSPANVMKLLEIVRGAKTAKDVLATCIDMGKKIGKKPVVSGVCDGFIGNRMLYAYRDAADEVMLQAPRRRRSTARWKISVLQWDLIGWAIWPDWTLAGQSASARRKPIRKHMKRSWPIACARPAVLARKQVRAGIVMWLAIASRRLTPRSKN